MFLRDIINVLKNKKLKYFIQIICTFRGSKVNPIDTFNVQLSEQKRVLMKIRIIIIIIYEESNGNRVDGIQSQIQFGIECQTCLRGCECGRPPKWRQS